MKVLVTAIGSMSAECVIGAFNRFGVDVVGTDIYPREYHPVAVECSGFYQIPRVYPDVDFYCNTIKNIAIKESCEAIVPLTDPEVDVISERRVLFEEAGVKVWLPSDNVIKRARNKGLWCKIVRESKSLKTIPTFRCYSDLKENYEGDFVAKKVTGRSSEGILFSNTSVFQCEGGLDGDYLFQPRISGEILTVDFAKHPKSGQLVFVPRIELMRTKNGAGTVVKIVELATCRDAVQELVDQLGLTGVMNCEFICSEDGLYLMDINPRFSAGVSFSKLAGYDFIKADMDCYCSEAMPMVSEVRTDAVFVKRFCDFGLCS